MGMIRLGFKGFIRRKKTSAIFTLIIFISAFSIMLSSLIIGVSDAFRATNENPYPDYYRMVVDRSSDIDDPHIFEVFGDMKFDSKDTMYCGMYVMIDEILSYFRNIEDYTLETAETFYTSAEPVIKYNVRDKGLKIYSIPECMSIQGFARGEITVTEGRYLTTDDSRVGAKVCLVSENLALLNGYSLGDKIMIESNGRPNGEVNIELQIVGIFKSRIWREEFRNGFSCDLFDNTVYVPFSSVPIGMFASCYNFQIKPDSDRHIGKIEELVNKYVMTEGKTYFIKVSDIYEADNGGVHFLSSALNVARVFFIFVSLAVIALYSYSMIQNRKKELGIYLAIGCSKPKTALIIATELLLCVLTGTALASATVYFFGADFSERILSLAANSSIFESVVASSSETVALSLERMGFVKNIVSQDMVYKVVMSSAGQSLTIAFLSSFAAIVRIFGVKVMGLLGKDGER